MRLKFCRVNANHVGLSNTLFDKAFKGTVVNPALPSLHEG